MEITELTVMISQVVDEILAKKQQDMKVIRVMVTGSERESLLDTLNCIKALYDSGYKIVITFSHSANNSVIKSVFLRWQQEDNIEFSVDSSLPNELSEDYYGLFFPAISINSLSKLALCIRDNLASNWFFHALLHRKPITTTVNNEYQTLIEHGTASLKEQVSTYLNQLENYGVSIIGKPQTSSAHPSLVTLRNVKLHPESQPLCIEKNTIITPAAKEEIARRRLIIEKIN